MTVSAWNNDFSGSLDEINPSQCNLPAAATEISRFAWKCSGVLVIICLLPWLLTILGFDLSSGGSSLSAEKLNGLSVTEFREAAFQLLHGSFTHTLLEWTAVCAAITVGFLAFVQFRITRELSLPVIGIALMCAGAMDAFHTLAADRLINAVADNQQLIPFTWAICRMFNGVIQLLGVGIFVFWIGKRWQWSSAWIVCISTVFVLAAYGIVHYCATSTTLPQTMFPDAFIKRPYDLFPMLPFLLCAVFVFPRYLRLRPTYFACSLLLSLIPQIATQLYMAFGSFQLHDAAFNIAHALKAGGYVMPAFGLLVDHIHTHHRHQTAESCLREYAEVMEEGNDALEDATIMAEAAAQSKAEFLANMSHEIRTPMTAILGYADILSDSLKHTENEQAIEIIRCNGNHLLTIINDILDLSKLEAGKMTVENIDCDPVQIVNDVKTLMQVRADAKSLYLITEYEGPIPQTIQSDPVRLRQILVNIVGNALKFTEHGSVRIVTSCPKVDDEQSIIQFDIIDTGIGMSQEQSAKLFQAFEQADSSTTRRFGGTGLGLAISKLLVERLAGTISVSCRPGEGCVFTVIVATGPLDGVKMIDNPAEHLNSTSSQSAHDTPANSVEQSTLQDVRILLAEDGPDNQRLITFHLKKAGAQVELAENGRIAVEKTMEAVQCDQPFDVILMDMQMPELDGYGATRQLRDQGYTRPIIALTAHAMSSDRDKCLHAGCDDFATKPIDRAALINTILHWATSSTDNTTQEQIFS